MTSTILRLLLPLNPVTTIDFISRRLLPLSPVSICPRSIFTVIHLTRYHGILPGFLCLLHAVLLMGLNTLWFLGKNRTLRGKLSKGDRTGGHFFPKKG